MEDLSLHKQAQEIARRFHQAEFELIDILQKVDEAKVWRSLGYSSLFDYSIRSLKLSEANASNFITVARKSKAVPELKLAIQTGDITVSKARKITPVLDAQNSSHWIGLAKTLPKNKLEKEVAKVFPQAATAERAKYVSASRIELKMGLSEEAMEKFRRAQDLVCQSTQGAATLEETLEALVDFYIQSKDPVKKAERAKVENEYVPGTHSINTATRNEINLRDQGQCTYQDDHGHRCQNRRWLEVHHRVPKYFGGTHSASNLVTLCSAHHRYLHLN